MSANVIEVEASSDWHRRGLLLLFGLASVILVLRDTYAEIFHFWWTYSAYNHCILIVPISLFLIFEKRGELFAQSPNESWWGYCYFLLNTILWTFGGLFSFAVFQHAAAIGLIIGLIWGLIGNRAARVIAFPLLYLYFGVPEGEILVPYLRDLTADVVVNLLRVTGIPVFMEGRYLTIPSGQFHVAKACSGINYLIATLAVGTVFAYTRYTSNWRRMAFMMLAIFVPLIANGMRAYGIVMIAHLSNYKYAMGVDHYIYGWVFFGIVIFILFAVGNTFSDKASFVQKAPNISWTEHNRSENKVPFVILAICLGTLLIINTAYLRGTSGNEVNDRYVLKAAPNWTVTSNDALNLFGSFEGNPIVLEGQLDSGDSPEPAWLQMVLYLNPEVHGELENGANLIFDEEKWQRLNGPETVASGVEGFPTVHEFILRRYGKQHLIWSWYDINGAITTSRTDAKWALIKARFAGQYRGGAQVTLVAAADNDVADTRALLRRVLVDFNPSMPNLRENATDK